jgi:N-acetylglucosaminyldiphosphoundecaprenol N-acetyl-beta-D-mannosaminyltransferase
MNEILEQHFHSRTEILPVNILGVAVDRLTPETLIDRVLALKPEHKPVTVMYANIHVLNTSRREPDLHAILNNADIVYCDGSGVRLGAWLLGHRIPPRMTGADWMQQLCSAAAGRGTSLYLLASRPGVAEAAAQALRTQCQGLNVVGTHHGYLQDPAASAAAITSINAARPHILFVGMGTPIQEKWIFDHRHELEVPVVWAVGALFDFIAGIQKRAPRWMLDHDLEWLHRFWVEPRRMWRRYIVGNPLFVWRVMMQRIGLLRVE